MASEACANVEMGAVEWLPAQPFGLYIHIPFCAARCIYCDFNTYIDREYLQNCYVEALLTEIALVGSALGHPPLTTVYFGGGTPTLLPPAQLGRLLEACADVFALDVEAEITAEANPSGVDGTSLRAMRCAGFNRISFGVQSFDEATLAFLGRWHSPDQARTAIRAARDAGFDNINLDLLYGVPRQSLSTWQQTIETALVLAPEHLSLYALIVEPGTPLARSINRGELPSPDDDVAATQYEWASERLAMAGYVQYELSNWVRDGGVPDPVTPALASQHNLVYWRNQCYAGLGAGAHSYVRGVRYANRKRPETYIRAIERGVMDEVLPAPALDKTTLDPIDRDLAMSEHMLLGLRLTREGVSTADFVHRFGISLDARFGSTIADAVERGLLERLPDRVRLTQQGFLLANQVLMEFL